METFDYFVAKYESDGMLYWIKQVGAKNGMTEGFGVSTDSLGNIYVAGSTSVGISGQQQSGNNDYFIAKYLPNGSLVWTTQAGAASGVTYAYAVSTDSLGNVYTTGETTVGLFGSKQNGSDDYFVAKYSDSAARLK